MAMYKSSIPGLLSLAVLAIAGPTLLLVTDSELRTSTGEVLGITNPDKFNLKCSGWIQKTETYTDEIKPTARRGYTFSVDLEKKQWCLKEEYKKASARCVRVKDIYLVSYDTITLEYSPEKQNEITLNRIDGTVYISSLEPSTRLRGEPLDAWVKGKIKCENRTFERLRDNRKF